MGVTAGARNNSAFFAPSAGEISTYAELVDQDSGAIVNNAIGVATFGSAGNPADKSFHVAVTC